MSTKEKWSKKFTVYVIQSNMHKTHINTIHMQIQHSTHVLSPPAWFINVTYLASFFYSYPSYNLVSTHKPE